MNHLDTHPAETEQHGHDQYCTNYIWSTSILFNPLLFISSLYLTGHVESCRFWCWLSVSRFRVETETLNLLNEALFCFDNTPSSWRLHNSPLIYTHLLTNYEMRYVCICNRLLGHVDTWIAGPSCYCCKEVFKQL